MAKQAWYKRLWIRWFITAIASLLIAFCVGLIIWGSHSSSTDIALGLLAGISALVAVGQWVFSFSSEKPERLQLPYVRELVHKRESFPMGDPAAANFHYITEPIQDAYDTANQALLDASMGVGPKCGILILGVANAGKTRLAIETLTQRLPGWRVLLWSTAYDKLSEVPSLAVSRGSGLVVFIDDLHQYVPTEGYDADGLGFLSDNRSATLQAFLSNMRTTEQLVVVATCRLEDEKRVEVRLRWLFKQLKVIELPKFKAEPTDPESANIIDLFRQHNATNVKEWDGTIGSLVLGLEKKREQYDDLVQSYHNLSVIVLRTMKLLTLALIPVHTYLRIQGVCIGVFGESTLQEDSKPWQDSVDQLTRLEFVIDDKDRVSGKYKLVIRKDAYFDKVITDYPAPNRPYELEQHFERLQKVLIELNDSSALVNLADAYCFNLKRNEEALVAYEQAIRLDPNLAAAYNNKGLVLGNLKRYKEALAAWEQTIRLDPDLAVAYSNEGFVLSYLKRNEEALVACEKAIQLDPNLALAYNNKGLALGNLGRNEKALAAYEQAIQLDPNFALAYNNKGVALGNLGRNEEALAAHEQAIQLNPNLVLAYSNKGTVLADLKRHEEALTAYEEAIRLDPNFAAAYYNKGITLLNLKRKEEALTAYEEAIRLDPTYALAYYEKGFVLADLERKEEALTAYEEAIRLDPTYAYVYNNMGNALADLKRYEEALAAYDQAIRLDPTYASAYNNKGTVLADLKRYEEALAAWEQAIRLDPTYASAYSNKGLALGHLKRYEEALAAHEQAIRLDPIDASAYSNKGIALSYLQRYEEALTVYEEAIRLDPTYAYAYNNKGNALRNLKRNEEALAAFDQAIRLDPNFILAYNNKAELLRMLGQEGGA